MLEQVLGQGALAGPPFLAVMSALGSVVILMAVLGLCAACKEKPAKSDDVEMDDVGNTDSVKRKKSGKGHKKQASSVSVIETELAENRHSNGSVANGKNKTHDRALPAIPNANDGTMPTDDEMDDDPGHYDVIPRAKKGAAAAANATKKEARKSKKKDSGGGGGPGGNPYAKVTGDPDSDYAGIKEDNLSAAISFPGMKVGDPGADPAADSDPVYSGIKEDGDDEEEERSDLSDAYSAVRGAGNHAYAVVKGVGDAQYAHIDEVAKQNRRSRLLQQSHRPAAESTGEDTASYASVPPPPVPDKNFDAASDTAGELGSPPPAAALSSSPSLPPRNSVAAATGNIAPLDVSQGSSDGGAGMMALPSNGAMVDLNGISRVTLGDGEDGAAAGASAAEIAAAIKEARYSKVTARESLDSLKKRQKAELQLHPPSVQTVPENGEDQLDSTYASVEYDEIRSPGASGVVLSPAAAGDRSSVTSDLYAEIPSGQNSQRSSTYARVADVHVFSEYAGAGGQAPAPPSLDTLKKKLIDSKLQTTEEEEMPDPGYSAIKRPRPQSVHSTASGQNHVTGRRSPVYAIVDKKQKSRNRQTVHVSENLTRDLDAAHSHQGAAPPSFENVYSEIDKSKKSQRSHGNNVTSPGGGHVHGGARPKVRNTHVVASNVMTSNQHAAAPGGAAARPVIRNINPGYHSIASVQQAAAPGVTGEADMYDPNYDSIPSDPNYDLIPERSMDAVAGDGGSDYDPNYESVTALTATITASSQAARSPTEPGVAREISTSGSARYPRREHIYQDIDEAKGGSSQHAATRGQHAPRVAPHSTAL